MVAVLTVLGGTPAEAYVGPGAGFALLSSFFVVFITMLIALVSLLAWPFRTLWRIVRRRRRPRSEVRRVVVLGFDGQDPGLTERLMAEGKLPTFSRLAENGGYRPLATTYPSVSPVAWSSFSTGTSPAKHNIFDFLSRDPRTYLPRLSSTHIGTVRRFLRIGPFRLPLARPEMRLLRRSKPFWSVLGEHGVWSTILRVPITFPPEPFHGALLAAMCVPDLLGSQGTFLLFTTRSSDERFKEGGLRLHLEGEGDELTTTIEGPENLFAADGRPLRLPVRVRLDRAAGTAKVRVGDSEVELTPRRLSDWVTVRFAAAPGIGVSGICRMQLLEMEDEVSVYVTPLNIDPERPAMPISHPSYYATYLAKKLGPYATLGLAEDTWGLNEGILDEATFLQLTNDIDAERQAQFFAALDRLREGALVCVFDATDRIQHMFWRYLDDDHPAARDDSSAVGRNAIEELYRRNDELVAKVLERLGPEDVLLILSDHGFASFRRGVNLNGWLLENGYLALKDGADGSGEWLTDVDWSRTRAYALGLAGIYLNVSGREEHGTVDPGEEAAALRRELVERLGGLVDPANGTTGINEVFDTRMVYQGPYLGNAPDLLVGYNRGYRVSWDCATGMVSGSVFADNPKAWSGDHCIDPRLVPGILFSNRPLATDEPSLLDIAPTVLRLFGVQPPAWMEGRAIFEPRPAAGRKVGKVRKEAA